ncbi:MAG TPA: saccharopine dehydrogenase NADP-binding domain-containing protein [Verrucomicrobiae bacterium]|nr:saccharopine dehydrogenase NADP-binding domain-containing protein [Verrucomicrobiae bacterium]
MAKAVPRTSKTVGDIKPVQPALKATRSSHSAPVAVNGRKENPTRNRDDARDWQFALAEPAPRLPNLLILGASGHVAQAFLQRLSVRRGDFGRLVLLDPNDDLLRNSHLDHSLLDYQFVPRALRLPADRTEYHALLREHAINVVVDVTDLDTLPVLTATDAAGVSYINTSLNESGRGVAELLSEVYPTRTRPRRVPHILSSGMNPGVVNLWVWHGVQQYGAPSEIVHFEYDSSVPASGWRPLITWSRQEFLTETVWEPTGLVVNGAVRMGAGNSLQQRVDLRPIMQPVVALPEYPRGLLVLHEENIKFGTRLGTSSKYVYAIHPRTMTYLEELWRERGRVNITDLTVGDNTSIPLDGSDTIGVCLNYLDKRVYYLHSLANRDVVGTNATCAQVAVGLDAALHALVLERLSPQIHFASDLYATVYSDVVFGALRVEHAVFEKQNGALVRRQRNSRLRPTFGRMGRGLGRARVDKADEAIEKTVNPSGSAEARRRLFAQAEPTH